MKASNLLSKFPADLLAASGIPIILAAFASSCLLSLKGISWIVAFIASIAAALLGAVLLFRAKLPLYHQRRFFSFGIRGVPESRQGTYRWGCRLSITGIVLASLLLLSAISWRVF